MGRFQGFSIWSKKSKFLNLVVSELLLHESAASLNDVIELICRKTSLPEREVRRFIKTLRYKGFLLTSRRRYFLTPTGIFFLSKVIKQRDR